MEFAGFLSNVGPEFDGLAHKVVGALGSDDLQEILSFVQAREDLSELDDVGIDSAAVDKLFAAIIAHQGDDEDPL